MTKGKYANSSEARRAREAAIQAAAKSEKEKARLAAENASLQEANDTLRRQIAEGVSADLDRAHERLAVATASAQELREQLKAAERAILDTYAAGVRRAASNGLSHDSACDYMDKVTTFSIKGEILPPSEVQVYWGDGAKILKATKVRAHRRGALRIADRVDAKQSNARFGREAQGIE